MEFRYRIELRVWAKQRRVVIRCMCTLNWFHSLVPSQHCQVTDFPCQLVHGWNKIVLLLVLCMITRQDDNWIGRVVVVGARSVHYLTAADSTGFVG